MEIIKPAYYDSFQCIAAACPDSCCKEWAVQVDEDTAAYYRTLPGALGTDLRSAMAEEDGDIILTLTSDGHCPMWRQDGLCRIQAELGEGALCRTCRQFPRLTHDFGDFVELDLELSCPEAARLVLSGDSHLCSRQTSGGETPEYDTDTMSILRHSRQQILAFLEQSNHGVGQSLAVMLLYGHAVQEALDGGEAAAFDPDALLHEAVSLAAPGSIADILTFFTSLEILTADWRSRLDAPAPDAWSEAHRAIVRYFVTRYWLQAVSDYDLISRVKLCIVSCLVIKAVGGDTLHTAQLYSKEIENDADNVNALLDAAYTSPAMADIRLLGLLLEE